MPALYSPVSAGNGGGVKPSPRTLLLLALLFPALPAGFAQLVMPLRVYTFSGSLNDSNGGPAPVASGGTVGSNQYSFGANQGLTLTDPLFNASSYTIELNFSFADLTSWKKIIDFNQLGSDTGLYSYNGSLQFFGPTYTSAATDFTVNTAVDVVLTRDGATGLVTGYVNGQAVLSFTDSGNAAVFSSAGNSLTFFIDDNATSQREASAGTANWIRLYDHPLAAADVLMLYQQGAPAAVPEPATAALFALGLAGWALFRRDRRPA
jgi:hypothetical protein